MSERALPARSRDERRRRRRRAQVSRWAIRVALGVAIFGLGVAVGEALHDNPRADYPFTQVRTLPLPRPASTSK